MKLNFKVFAEGKSLLFQDAVKKGLLNVTSHGMEWSEEVTVCESTGLVDKNGEEIYEQDLLVDADGRTYIVERLLGTFFIKDCNDSKGCIPVAMTGLKLGNRIDTLVVTAKSSC